MLTGVSDPRTVYLGEKSHLFEKRGEVSERLADCLSVYSLEFTLATYSWSGRKITSYTIISETGYAVDVNGRRWPQPVPLLCATKGYSDSAIAP